MKTVNIRIAYVPQGFVGRYEWAVIIPGAIPQWRKGGSTIDTARAAAEETYKGQSVKLIFTYP